MGLQNFLDSKKQPVTKGDYLYTYDNASKGWQVNVVDKTKLQYEPIADVINGLPVVSMRYTYAECDNLIVAPPIPQTVIDMAGTFMHCKKLITAPQIPNGVKNMFYTFEGCSALSIAPNIPHGAINTKGIFDGCNFDLSVADKVLSNNEQLSVPSGTDENNSHDEHDI